jgi:hypothetical protein
VRTWSKFVALPLVLAGGLLVGLESPAAAPEPEPPSPVHFVLEVSGIGVFSFSRCAGIGSETAVTEFSEGPGDLQHIPGATTPLSLTCMRAYQTNLTLDAWRESVVAGSGDPWTGSLIWYDSSLTEVGRWTYFMIWPRSLVLQLDGSGLPYEVVSFVADAVDRAS